MSTSRRVTTMSTTRSGGRFRKASRQTDHAKLQRLQRQVAALRPELKYYQESATLSNIGAAVGLVTYVSGIAQGSDDINRIGNQITVKSVDMNIKCVSGYSSNPATYVVYLIRDNDSNGVLPTVSGTVNSILTGSQPINQLLRTAEGRFKILRKKQLSGLMLASGSEQFVFTWSIKLNTILTYRGTTGAQANAGKHALYLVIVSDDASDTVDFAYSSQIGFTDV